jgi:hypothetical protein
MELLEPCKAMNHPWPAACRLPRQGGYDQQPGAWMLQQRLSSLSPRASDTRVSGIIYRTLMDEKLALMP